MGRKSRKSKVDIIYDGIQEIKKTNKIEQALQSHKKVSCNYHQKGLCNRGKECNFLHNFQPQMQKELCKYHLVGGCQNSPCYFSHETQLFHCKHLYIGGKCDKGFFCKFNHQAFLNEEQLVDFIELHRDMILNFLKEKKFTEVIKYALKMNLVNVPQEPIQISELNAFYKEVLPEVKIKKIDEFFKPFNQFKRV